MRPKAKKAFKIFDRKGASAIEMAIVLPLLLLLIFGIIEFGIICYDKAVVTNASREGARTGIVFSVPEVTNAQITDVVNAYCSTYLITFGTTNPPVTTIASIILPTGAKGLAVNVQYQYDFLVVPDIINLLIGGSFGDGLTLEAETVMRMEDQGA